MITGTVTSHREAIIRLIVRGPSGQEEEIEAVIDTGFNLLEWRCYPGIASLWTSWIKAA